jgi:uncharacterized protein YqeY
MALRERISDDLKTAMKARDEVRVGTLRLIQAAIKDRDIAARTSDRPQGCEEVEIQAILSKMAKQREESAEAFENAGRLELAEREREEQEIVQSYMPRQLSETEIRNATAAVVAELDATGLKDMGRCMQALKSRYAGQMDFSKAGAQVKDMLK